VVIAGALALKPEVIVADEPVSSLDASVRGEILALLRSLRDRLGLAVLVVTHDLGLAWNIADRLAVMYLGRIIETGATEEVLAAPSHPYTKALLSVLPESNHMQPIILQGEPPDPSNIPSGCRFNPRCPAIVDGSAERAGIVGECMSGTLPVLPSTGKHLSACLLHRDTGSLITPVAAEVPAQH
jgi:oligopeptide/dipeptide ABC transporter ATP-binding protein